MQTLVLEEAWERTISEQDHQDIITIFNKTKEARKKIIPIRSAFNHRDDLLITVLLHNFADTKLDLRNVTIQLLQEDETLATQHFQDNRLLLDPATSMPWTFIFPENSYSSLENFDKHSYQMIMIP
ncbi:SLAP domain-containing protein [Gracilibacillus kekensis]|uniref:SLAP domain-containing protein n=1 Tax=Gracilibacillus kekensis TaxID=1027249 RepID=A0A1M7QBM5_9BACI|nr:SLAP domain-containing protein [Gracilibacillus kekensis]SHN27900.1 SLAP domain-containing protein [Gracilibacillus kekensis]